MEKKRVFGLIFSIVFFIIENIFGVDISLAQENPRIIISPAFSEVSISESEPEKIVNISITNNTLIDSEFNIQAVEVRQVDEQGNIGFVDKPQSINNAFADFIEAIDKVSIANGETKVIPIIIKNNINLPSGGHYVAIIAQLTSENSNTNAYISPALSSFLLIKKEGGDRYQISMRDREKVKVLNWSILNSYNVTFENQGNVHVKPRGVILVTDIFGRTIKKGIINEDSKIILPGARRQIDVKLYNVSPSFPFMLLSLKLNGESEDGAIPFSDSSTFIYVSKNFLIIIFLLLIFVPLLLKKFRRKKQHEV